MDDFQGADDDNDNDAHLMQDREDQQDNEQDARMDLNPAPRPRIAHLEADQEEEKGEVADQDVMLLQEDAILHVQVLDVALVGQGDA